MDEISRGVDEMVLHSADSTGLPLCEDGDTEASCGCSDLVRIDSAGIIPTPLHRCKGRHQLPIVGKEMQGDQPEKQEKGDKSEQSKDSSEEQDKPDVSRDSDSLPQKSDQANSEDDSDFVLCSQSMQGSRIICHSPSLELERCTDSSSTELAQVRSPELSPKERAGRTSGDLGSGSENSRRSPTTVLFRPPSTVSGVELPANADVHESPSTSVDLEDTLSVVQVAQKKSGDSQEFSAEPLDNKEDINSSEVEQERKEG